MGNGEKTNDNKVWEVLLKISVPLGFILGGAMVRNEIVDTRQDTQIQTNKEDIDGKPPKWLSDAVTRIELTQARMESKLESLDDRMDKIEAKVK